MKNDIAHSRSAGPPGPAGSSGRWVRALRLLVAAALILGFAAPGLGDSESDSLPDTTDILDGVVPPPQREVLRAPADPIRVGESLRFSVQWGFIKAGTAWLEVPEKRDWNGHASYLLVARAESNHFIDGFYKVRNRIESVWDSVSRSSWRYLEDRHEGGTTANDTIEFNREGREARYKDGRTFPIPPNVQDALSSFYFTRTQDLPIGGSIVFDYHASRKSLPLEVKVLGRQRVKTPAGRFDCIVVEPVLNAGGIFKNKGRLVIWLTEDERRIPVLMKSKVLIGSIKVVLQEVKSGA